LFKRLLKNRKGTAEVVGSVMFIIILLFFFTNVYLWHDAATKQMDELQFQKINSPISVTYNSGTQTLNVIDNGGQDAVISGLWVIEQSVTGVPDSGHQFFNLASHGYVVRAGASAISIPLNSMSYNPIGKTGIFKVVTSNGNIASCPF
jgi:hypothetical protein